jgi:hypothetical protein
MTRYVNGSFGFAMAIGGPCFGDAWRFYPTLSGGGHKMWTQLSGWVNLMESEF